VSLSFLQPSNTNTVTDARRMIRPFFLTPDGKAPLPSKRYYDIFTFILTQVAFAYTVAPFILLSFGSTLTVWARVYFYALIGTAASFALFSRSLPFRKQLLARQSARAAPASSTSASTLDSSIERVAQEEVRKDKQRREMQRTASNESGFKRAPTLGIADDPEAEVDEIIAEVKKEIEERRRRGSLMQGFDVRKAVEQKVKEFQKGS
jgi:lysophospholipid acyltransferase